MKDETLPGNRIEVIETDDSIYLPLDIQIDLYLIHFTKGNLFLLNSNTPSISLKFKRIVLK